MGANPALSWIGVLGYAGGSSLPALVRLYLYNIYTLCSLFPQSLFTHHFHYLMFPMFQIIGLIGPRVRKISGENRAFATTDFAKQRFGRLMQLSVACISVFYSE